MDLPFTTTIFCIGLVLTIIANVLSRRPRQPDRIWVVPYNALQFIGILTMIVMGAHLVTLLTGRPFTGRMG